MNRAMGENFISRPTDSDEIRLFTRALIQDLKALELMLDRDRFERGIRRMGVEQELFLVDGTCRPAAVSHQVLERIDRPGFTTELARFNLEANIPPRPLEGDFLHRMEDDLTDAVATVDQAAGALGARAVLAGILPTLRRDDLRLDNITPEPRYHQLDAALRRHRGEDFAVVIRGRDILELSEPSVMLESANTSFQLHLQVEPDEFAELYNLAQLVTAPLLAVAVNSPLFLGKRLWRETRVALFERATDARSVAERVRGNNLRVCFGQTWHRGSILDLYRDDATRYPVLLTGEIDEDPVAVVEAGGVPRLRAMNLHNGTIWRWNRACYGWNEGVAHLRVENRVLPSGPTVLDEVANAALYYGLVLGGRTAFAGFMDAIPFEEVRANFINAACHGLDARLLWLDGERRTAKDLLLDTLVDVAAQGLQSVGVGAADLERYLGTVRARVETGTTGARWILQERASIASETTPYRWARHMTAAMIRGQRSGLPVHRWGDDVGASKEAGTEPRTVGDVMTTELFTVRPDDAVDLAVTVMDWRGVGHVPVEDTTGRPVGLVSHRTTLRLYERREELTAGAPPPVKEFMNPEPDIIGPDALLEDAIPAVLATESGALLVVSDGRLIGVVTIRDLLKIHA